MVLLRVSIDYVDEVDFLVYAISLMCQTCVDVISYDGRVVKAFDLKSNGIFPRRFESYS